MEGIIGTIRKAGILMKIFNVGSLNIDHVDRQICPSSMYYFVDTIKVGETDLYFPNRMVLRKWNNYITISYSGGFCSWTADRFVLALIMLNSATFSGVFYNTLLSFEGLYHKFYLISLYRR